jgi:hypothetical protein
MTHDAANVCILHYCCCLVYYLEFMCATGRATCVGLARTIHTHIYVLRINSVLYRMGRLRSSYDPSLIYIYGVLTVYIRCFWQGIHQIYGVYIRIYKRFWPTLHMCATGRANGNEQGNAHRDM